MSRLVIALALYAAIGLVVAIVTYKAVVAILLSEIALALA